MFALNVAYTKFDLLFRIGHGMRWDIGLEKMV